MKPLTRVQDATPPKDPYIKIRVLQHIGEVLLGDQTTSLSRNSIHFMKRTEAEPLISQVTLPHDFSMQMGAIHS
jgi:GINS complex subunit 1